MNTLEADGRTLVMDDDVYEFLKDKAIEFTTGGYPIVSLHRMFFPKRAPEEVIDHRNRNILDFRRDNLRAVSYSVNNRNRRKQINSTSVYKGVNRWQNCWVSKIRVNGREVFLGRWNDESHAARAYDIATLFFYPENELLNFDRTCYDGVDLKRELEQVVKKPPRNNKSGYRGVLPTRNGKRFYAYAKIGPNNVYLGVFDTAEQAARAHDRALFPIVSKNTKLNFWDFEQWLEELGYGVSDEDKRKAA